MNSTDAQLVRTLPAALLLMLLATTGVHSSCRLLLEPIPSNEIPGPTAEPQPTNSTVYGKPAAGRIKHRHQKPSIAICGSSSRPGRHG
ncbi:hypothetical protein LINPERHAP1_LOCUS9736 [Linum perenne]